MQETFVYDLSPSSVLWVYLNKTVESHSSFNAYINLYIAPNFYREATVSFFSII